MGMINDGDLLFSCECDEPEGKVIRSVYKVSFTKENLEKLWERASKFRTLMGQEILTRDQFYGFFVRPNKDNDLQYESKGLCARIDDFVGIFWLTDISDSPPFDASIHYTFFDRRAKGRLNLCRAAIKYVFDTYGFNKLYTHVPLFTRPTLAFVEAIGFHKEGRLEKNRIYKGQLFDTNLYALTKNDVKNWEI